jgi:hypothetical protein
VLPAGKEEIALAVTSVRRWLIWTSLLLLFAVGCVLGAFAASGYSSVSLVDDLPNITATMTITTSFGAFVCVITGFFFCSRLYKLRRPVEGFRGC